MVVSHVGLQPVGVRHGGGGGMGSVPPVLRTLVPSLCLVNLSTDYTSGFLFGYE